MKLSQLVLLAAVSLLALPVDAQTASDMQTLAQKFNQHLAGVMR